MGQFIKIQFENEQIKVNLQHKNNGKTNFTLFEKTITQQLNYSKPNHFTTSKLPYICNSALRVYSQRKMSLKRFLNETWSIVLLKKKLTPMIAFNSGIVTCLARSTAWSTDCWCSGCKHGRSWFINALKRFAISVYK